MARLDEPRWPTRVLVVTRATGAELKVHGHPVAAITPILCNFLINAGFEVELSNNLDRVKNANLELGIGTFDAIVFSGKIEQPDDEAVRSLRSFVEAGRGLVVIHIASASFEGSAEWLDLIGSAWVYGEGKSTHPEPPGPIRMEVTQPDHPIMAGLPREFWFAKEELYQRMGQSERFGPGDAIARGYDERDGNITSEPTAFVMDRGRGRVFNLYPGHFVSTHSDWRFQKMVVQGIQWAARR